MRHSLPRQKVFALLWGLPLLAGAIHAQDKASAIPDGTELLANHDFSVAKKDPTFPDEWNRKPWMTWEEEKGVHFLRLASTSTGKDFSVWREISLPAPVKAVEVSIRYRVKDVKLSDEKDDGVRSVFAFSDAVRIKFKPAPATLVLSSQAAEWTTAVAKIAVPENAVSLWLSVGLFGAQSGVLDLADVSVKSLPAEDVPVQDQPGAVASSTDSVPLRREGAHTIIGYGKPAIWFIHPYVDVLGHDFDLGITNLVRQAHDQGRSIAVGVAPSLDDVNQADEKSTIYVFTYKNIGFPVPEQAQRLVFINTWLLPQVAWPGARLQKKDIVMIGSKMLHNDGDGLATNKDRWWQIQKADPDLTLTVLDSTGYYLPIPTWRLALLKLILETPAPQGKQTEATPISHGTRISSNARIESDLASTLRN